MIPWPPIVPWYKFQGTRSCCPECGALLKSKYDPLYSRLKIATNLIILSKFIFGISNAMELIVFYTICAVLFSWVAVLGYREYRHEDFYVRDDKS
jgi:uncharacterized membrane protein YdbT with pleckstrin-like domain